MKPRYEGPQLVPLGNLNDQLEGGCCARDVTYVEDSTGRGIDPKLATYAVGALVWTTYGNRGERQLARVVGERPRIVHEERFWRVEPYFGSKARWSLEVVERRIVRLVNRQELANLRAAGICR